MRSEARIRVCKHQQRASVIRESTKENCKSSYPLAPEHFQVDNVPGSCLAVWENFWGFFLTEKLNVPFMVA